MQFDRSRSSFKRKHWTKLLNLFPCLFCALSRSVCVRENSYGLIVKELFQANIVCI